MGRGRKRVHGKDEQASEGIAPVVSAAITSDERAQVLWDLPVRGMG